MKIRTLLEAVFFIIIVGIMLYIIMPKYDYHYRYKPELSAPQIWRANTITGKVEFFNPNDTDWITWVKK